MRLSELIEHERRLGRTTSRALPSTYGTENGDRPRDASGWEGFCSVHTRESRPCHVDVGVLDDRNVECDRTRLVTI